MEIPGGAGCVGDRDEVEAPDAGVARAGCIAGTSDQDERGVQEVRVVVVVGDIQRGRGGADEAAVARAGELLLVGGVVLAGEERDRLVVVGRAVRGAAPRDVGVVVLVLAEADQQRLGGGVPQRPSKLWV